MTVNNEYQGEQYREPNMDRARRTANVAHSVVIKFKEMGIPEELDGPLSSLSTDLGDLWSACNEFQELLETFLKSDHDWELSADQLVDIKSSLDHMAWHFKSIRRPLNRVAQYAYRQEPKH